MSALSTHVSDWETRGATCECFDCPWTARSYSTHDAIQAARVHAIDTRHEVGIATKRHATVTVVASDGFEAMGVPAEPDLDERRVWDAGRVS